MPTLGDRIKDLREKKGWTQDTLSGHLGMSGKQTISNWENNKNEPSLAVLRTLAGLFGTTVSYLVEGVAPSPSTETPAGYTLVPSEEIIKMQRELLQYREQELKKKSEEIERQKAL